MVASSVPIYKLHGDLLKPEEGYLFAFRSFELRLHISLGPSKLTMIPRVKNTDKKSFSFAFSMRNYLSVSDISEVRVEGLETLDYFNNLLHRERFTDTLKKIATIDHEKKRTFVLHKEGLSDAGMELPLDDSVEQLEWKPRMVNIDG
ncbi:hypothetical protein L1049_006021 [Liquidambar formosana]|uniref:Uncharacterized protein n=1 Tax=Liquidambar formosana TaxID=63359 RepID=A0AAP0WQG2_LIQFO